MWWWNGKFEFISDGNTKRDLFPGQPQVKKARVVRKVVNQLKKAAAKSAPKK